MIVEKGINFGHIHSYHDLNLILSKYEIKPATPKTNYVDIPGGDGSIDLTEAHGRVVYNDRECTFTFTVAPSDDLTFEEKKTQIANALNGKRFEIVLDKDPEYYYSGRCTINDWQQDRNLKQIVVSAKVAPYKRKIGETVFSVDLTEEEQSVILTNGRMPVIPVITCTDETRIVFGNNEFRLSAGTHKILEFCLVEGNNEISVSGSGGVLGSGTVTFTYREGDL